MLGLYRGCIGATLGLYGVIFGLYWDSGKEMETSVFRVWGLRFRG